MEAVAVGGGLADEDVGTDGVESHFAGRPQIAHELARSWMTELKELIGLAANDDRPEPLQAWLSDGKI